MDKLTNLNITHKKTTVVYIGNKSMLIHFFIMGKLGNRFAEVILIRYHSYSNSSFTGTYNILWTLFINLSLIIIIIKTFSY